MRDPLVCRAKNPAAESRWVPLLEGRITASCSPSTDRLDQWFRAGATDVVCLQRGDEMRAGLAAQVQGRGLRWHHYPLSGRRLERPRDQDTLSRLRGLLPLFELDRRVIVHCAAGLHRTGLCLYLLMRQAGLSADQSLARVRRARRVTAEELTRSTRRSGCLLDRAEGWLGAMAGLIEKSSRARDGRVGGGSDVKSRLARSDEEE